MKVDARIGAVSTLLRNLSQSDVQAHVAKLPELSDRIKEIQNALETLKAKRLEVDQANSAAPKVLPLRDLKKEAAAKLEKVVDYLKAMAARDPDTYGEDFAVVTQIITRLNTTRKRQAPLHRGGVRRRRGRQNGRSVSASHQRLTWQNELNLAY